MGRSILRWVRSAFMLVVLSPQAACGAGWHRIEPAAPSNLAKGQQVQVWQNGQRVQLHAVRVDRDSISGVPFQRPADCDSCRISLPRSTVDSIRAGDPTAAFLKSVGLALGSWLALGLLYAIRGPET
jgi:hypothetical protein